MPPVSDHGILHPDKASLAIPYSLARTIRFLRSRRALFDYSCAGQPEIG